MRTIFSQSKFLLSISVVFLFFSSILCASAKTLEISKNKSISYTDVGNGAPLILIHAFPTDKRLWDVQQKQLSKYFRVIALDLWGFGESSAVDGRVVTMSDYADQVKQLMDHLNIKNATIGGESMGGYVALALLDKYPDKVASLILSNTQAVADSDTAKASREKVAVDVLEHGTANLVDSFMSKVMSTRASDQTKQTLRKILASQPAAAMASALRGMAARTDTSSLLAKSSLRILIITSDQDNIILPAQSEAMHALAKNSKLVVIKNAGHLSSLEQPESWNKAVTDMFYVPPVN